MKNDSSGSEHIVNEWLQKLDMFDIPISLTHKKKNQFKTAIGGVFSIFLYLFMTFVVVNITMKMVNRKDINVVETTTQIEQFEGQNSVNPFENKKFMIGFSVVSNSFSPT